MTVLGHLDQHPGIDPPSFTATVTGISADSIEMDETFYYPKGGGQPADKGTITTDTFQCNVYDVAKEDSVFHMIDGINGVVNVGDRISCSIDTNWRNQLSAMHTAQHIISALANEEWGADTVGNQIGFDRTRIDLKFENRDAFEANHLEEMVNDAIENNLLVSMDYRDSKELINDPLVRVNMERMPPNIDVWRTISIGEIDVCPCAGTHVPRTGMIGPIEITKVKSKGAGKLRVEYVLNE